MDRVSAFRAARQAVLDLAQTLDDVAWAAPSEAAGWSVGDVIAHLAATVHDSLTLRAPSLMLARSVERYNDRAVERRARRGRERQIAEYRVWSGRFAAIYGRLAASPASGLPIRLGDLGRYPARLLVSAAVFDHHTHLRHDIAPALKLPTPPTDANRMAVVLEWIFANLERTGGASLAWLRQPVTVDLSGPGGGSWTVEPSEDRGPRVRPGHDPGAAITVAGAATDAPRWMTGRSNWRQIDVAVSGNHDVAARFLDSIKIT